MNEKRKLIRHFAWDCCLIILWFLTLASHSRLAFQSFFALCALGRLAALISKKILRKKTGPIHRRKTDRELTTAEAIAVFAMGISALYLGFFVIDKGLLNNLGFIIPTGIIFLAIRLFKFSTDLTGLQVSHSVSN